MKESKKVFEKALVVIGESLGMGEATVLLLKNVGVHSTVRELTYKMFTENKQQYFEQDDAVFEAISLMRKYCVEMSLKGEVNFDDK